MHANFEFSVSFVNFLGEGKAFGLEDDVNGRGEWNVHRWPRDMAWGGKNIMD